MSGTHLITESQIHSNFFSGKHHNDDIINVQFEQCDLSNEALSMTSDTKSVLGKRRRANGNELGLPKSRKKGFIKRFRKEWMDEPLFKQWLQPVETNPEKGYCSVCNVILIAGHSELEKHASGKKHCEMLFSGLSSLDNTVEDDAEFILINQKEDSDSNTEMVLEPPDLVSDHDFVYFRNGTILPQNRPTARMSFTESPISIKPPAARMNFVKALKPSGHEGKVIATAQLQLPDPKANALPENPDAEKLLNCLNSESEDEESLYELEDSAHLLREMRAELAYGEKKRNEEPFSSKAPVAGPPRDLEEYQRYLAEKEMEAKLRLIEERRKQNLNIYKLKLIEMEAKIRLAEGEVQRSTELHKLRLDQLRKRSLSQSSDRNFSVDTE